MRKMIVGVDPGTTVAVAFLGLDGKAIGIISGKGLSMNDVARSISERGDMLVLATDKKELPVKMRRLKAMFNCKLYLPPESLSKAEKLGLTRNHVVANQHERDALAAALKAYNSWLPRLKSIRKNFPDDFEGRAAEVMLGKMPQERGAKTIVISRETDQSRRLRDKLNSVLAENGRKDRQIGAMSAELSRLRRAPPEDIFLRRENEALSHRLGRIAGAFSDGRLEKAPKGGFRGKTDDPEYFARLAREGKSIELVDIIHEDERNVYYTSVERHEAPDPGILDRIVENYRKKRDK